MSTERQSIKDVWLTILCLAVGVFAVATEGFMIAGLLPTIATDLSVSVAAAGQLVTAFSLTYAISAPLLNVLTSGVERRRLLVASIALFAICNAVATFATDYVTLMGARLLLAIAAGLFMPAVVAFAASLVTPEMRGRALALLNTGSTLAITLGVPLAALIGQAYGWRVTFAIVAAIAAASAVLILARLPRSGVVTSGETLRARLAVAARFDVFIALLTTIFWAAGLSVISTYIAPLVEHAAGIKAHYLGGILLGIGISCIVGAYLGGILTDARGAGFVRFAAISALVAGYVLLTLIAAGAPSFFATPYLVLLLIFGCAAGTWVFYAAQQVWLLRLATQELGPVAISLNASCMYVGLALGASLGGVVIEFASGRSLGFVAAVCEGLALALLRVTRGRAPAESASPKP